MNLESKDVTPIESKAAYNTIKKYISDKYRAKVFPHYILKRNENTAYGLEKIIIFPKRMMPEYQFAQLKRYDSKDFKKFSNVPYEI